MAKHCDVCNQDYADDLPVCPHCAAAKKTQLASPRDERATQLADFNAAGPASELPPSQPEINLGSSPIVEAGPVRVPADSAIVLPPQIAAAGKAGGEETAPISSASNVAWSALVEEPSAEKVKVDAPSDADLLARAAAEVEATPPSHEEMVGELGAAEASAPESAEGGEGEGIDLSAAPPKAAKAGSDSSAVDLGGSLAEVVEGGSGAEVKQTPPGESEVFMAELASDASRVDLVGGSGVQITGQEPAMSAPEEAGSRPASESYVDLGSQPEVEAAESGSTPSFSKIGESGIDFGAAAEPAASPSDLALESLLSDQSSKEKLAEKEAVADGEESAVREKEVDDLAGEEAAAEEKPAKPVGKRSRILYMVGATGLGILIGAGGDRVLMGPGEKPKTQIQSLAQQPRATSPEDLAKMVQNGDYEAAAKAGIEQAPANTEQELSRRGEYRLFNYLKTQKVGAAVNPADPGLAQALDDLTKAAEKDADALYNLGLINEMAGDLPKARQEYAKGLQAFPAQKRRFQAALDRVDLKATEKAPGAARAPMQERERIALLALLLISLQQQPVQQQQPPDQAQPPGQQPPQAGQPQTEGEEAGFEFWSAAKLARQGQFAEAVRALDKARALHQERRFSRLRKAQNPLSDPTEDIFLRCCDELKASWKMQDHLSDGGYLTDKNTAPQALDNLIQTAQNNAATVKGISDKLVTAKAIAQGDDVSKGIDRALTAKKDAEDKAAELKTELEKVTKTVDEQAAKAEKAVKDLNEKLADADAQAKKLKADNANLSATLKKITDELAAAKLVNPNDKKVDVNDAVRKAVEAAKAKDPSGVIRQQRGEIDRLTAALKGRLRSEEMMPLWRLLLEQNRGRTDLASQAAQDAARVQTGPEATTAQKGESQIVQGLALRNNEKFPEAKAALEAGRMTVDRGEWLMTAEAALREVSDPAAYYGMQAQELSDRGQLDAALTLLDRAQKVLPEKQHPKLFSQRSLIELDAARSKARGALSPRDPLVAAAGKDAAAAAKAGLAEGHYAAGRVAEELGQWNAAIQNYRRALDAHKALDAEGGRYRMALARVLLQPRNTPPGQPLPAPAPNGNKVGWRDPAPYPAHLQQDMKKAVLMLVLGLQAPLMPGDEQGLDEAERLADEILRARPGTFPFNVHAQALAIKGLWSEALREYVAGIRPMLPREYGDGLLYLILNDPCRKRPDSLRIPNPMEAERHFAAGLNFYFDCDFANAEKEFLLTLRNDNQDARYFYFLGLSRLGAGNRRDAIADFAAGAELERVNRPPPGVVSESLERIQGPMRGIVNEYRSRPERLEPVVPMRQP
jgi:tetratricopeptide (TPR) repeat protein